MKSVPFIRSAFAVAIATMIAAIAACTSTSLTGPSGSVTKCQVSLTSPASAAAAAGGTLSLSVGAAPECAWSAATQTAWISDLAPASGQGAMSVQFKIAANPAASARQGEIVVNGVTARVSQDAAPCSFDVNPKSTAVPAEGGSTTATVTALSGCTWTAVSQTSWLTVTSGQSGSGNGTIVFSAAVNPDVVNGRTGTILAAGQSIVVTQPARGCQLTLDQSQQTVPAVGVSGTVAVTAAANCAWTASPDVSWISVTSGSPATGTGSFTYTVAANGGAARTGRIVVGGEIFTIVQADAVSGCSYSVAPTTVPMSNAGGNGSVAITSSGGCAWTATSNASWITIVSGASGTGSGAVSFSVATNSGAARSGTLTVGGQTITVNQAGVSAATCAYTLAPPSQSVAAGGGAATAINVTTGPTCTWSASTAATWLHFAGTSSGTGPGSIAITVDPNSGGARSGSVSVGGQSVTIDQAPAASPTCTYQVAPTTHSIAIGGGNSSVTVTTSSGCAWSATSHDGWITVNNGASGNGSGTVDFSASANLGGARSGTLTIAGTTVTVNQSALVCNYTIAPHSENVPATAGTGTAITVTTPQPLLCSWSAATQDSWIHLGAPSSGSGNGTLTWTYDANAGASRTGTIAISGQSFTVTQAAQASACSFSLNKTSESVKSKGESNQVNVIASAGCQWTASTQAAWITIRNGASGTGNGTVAYEVSANNTGVNRTGTIVIAGITFTVTQGHG